jgi:hypothetical protein
LWKNSNARTGSILGYLTPKSAGNLIGTKNKSNIPAAIQTIRMARPVDGDIPQALPT